MRGLLGRARERRVLRGARALAFEAGEWRGWFPDDSQVGLAADAMLRLAFEAVSGCPPSRTD